jgi:hypothetical protein
MPLLPAAKTVSDGHHDQLAQLCSDGYDLDKGVERVKVGRVSRKRGVRASTLGLR